MRSLVVVSLLCTLSAARLPRAETPPHVIFVCEHGAARSLIAAAYFNKLAAERGLKARAVFRGVTPQDELSVRAVAGLRADGLPIPDEKPTAIGAADISKATHIFAIGCALPAAATASGKAGSWADVPGDQGYEPMRDAIVVKVRQLLDSLAPKGALEQSRLSSPATSAGNDVATRRHGSA